jgi:hypothetical protein
MFFPCGPGQVRLGQRCRCPKRVTAAREAPIWATEQPSPGAPTPGSACRLARRPGRVMGRCCTSGTKLDCAALWPVPIRISRPISQRQLGLYLNPPKECSDFVHRSEDHHLRSGPLQPPLCRCAPGGTSGHRVRPPWPGLAVCRRGGCPTGRCWGAAPHVIDNLAAHKTSMVRGWQKQRPSVHFHLTPTVPAG